jgi:hypothetical protein
VIIQMGHGTLDIMSSDVGSLICGPDLKCQRSTTMWSWYHIRHTHLPLLGK